jgi:hypothetical protein
MNENKIISILETIPKDILIKCAEQLKHGNIEQSNKGNCITRSKVPLREYQVNAIEFIKVSKDIKTIYVYEILT